MRHLGSEKDPQQNFLFDLRSACSMCSLTLQWPASHIIQVRDKVVGMNALTSTNIIPSSSECLQGAAERKPLRPTELQ